VSADDGVVQVICPPRQTEIVPLVQTVLGSLGDIKEISTTIAQSSVLFLQDGFDHAAGEFDELLKVAGNWDAAVELMRFSQTAALLEPEQALAAHGVPASAADTDPADSAELSLCLRDLRQRGCSGGSSTFCGDAKALVNRIARNQ
jgi:hypothetical protein